MTKDELLAKLEEERQFALKVKEPFMALGIGQAMQVVSDNLENDSISVSKSEYNELLFKASQIEQINKAADELENAEIDGFDFGERVLNIL